ncbi:hypothetical protein L0M19_25585, partial [Streptomyces indiaensis]|nr:hypothetical protein [Streptomyces indiaensis]
MNGPDRFEAYDGDEGENDHDEQADPRDGDGIRDVGALQHESGTRDENGTPDGDAENAPAPGGPDGSGSPQDSGGPDTPENPGSPGGSGRSDGLGGPGGPEDPEGTGGPGTPSSPESTRGPDEPGTPSSPESTGGPDAPESTGGLGRAVSGE